MYTGMLDHPTYEFTTNHGDKHTIDGWFSSWGDHIVLDVNLPVFAHWLHNVEFKRPKDVADYLIDDYSPHRDLWDEYLWRILDSASNCDTEQELNNNLAWALQDTTTNSKQSRRPARPTGTGKENARRTHIVSVRCAHLFLHKRTEHGRRSRHYPS